jgi:ATP-dependent Clp protease ATP-binding subunit ClpC
MMYDRFSDTALKAMRRANQNAKRFGHDYICSHHIFLGLIKNPQGVTAKVLKNLNLDIRKLYVEVAEFVQTGPEDLTKSISLPRAKKIVEYAIEEARHLNHNYVGTEHLLLGVLRDKEGMVGKVLMNLGVSLEDVRRELVNVLGILR